MARRKSNKNKYSNQRQVRRDAFLKLGMIFLAILLIADTVQIARFGEIVERVDHYNKGVVDELGGFRQDIMNFGSDINEMRSFLLMPTKKYSFMEQGEEIEEDNQQEASATEKALYQFMGSYIEEGNVSKNAQLAEERIQTFGTDSALKSELEASGLSVGAVLKDDFSLSFKISSEEEPLFAVVADKKTGEMKVQSVMGSYSLEGSDDEAIKSDLISYVTENKDKVATTKQTIEEQKKLITGLKDNEEVATILKEKKLTFMTDPEEDDEKISYNIINSEENTLLTIAIKREDGSVEMSEKSYADDASLTSAFIDELGQLDGATSLEKLITERRAELEAVFNEEAFKELLSSNDLSVDSEPRAEYNKLLYDVKNADGQTQFSFVIELSSGLFKVLRDNEEIDLYPALQESSKKKP